MTRLLLIVAAIATLVAQHPPDESRVPESEKRIPPGHYCKHTEPGPRETSAHQCACTYSCRIDSNGTVTESESPSCLAFCHVNGRRCTCWPEGDPLHPCQHSDSDHAHGQAWMDMNGRVIAVSRAYRGR